MGAVPFRLCTNWYNLLALLCYSLIYLSQCIPSSILKTSIISIPLMFICMPTTFRVMLQTDFSGFYTVLQCNFSLSQIMVVCYVLVG